MDSTECRCGKKFLSTITNFNNGKQQCNECGFKRRPRKIKLTYNDIAKEIESNGSKLITPQDKFENIINLKKKSPTQVKLEIFCCNCKHEILETNLRRLRERGKYHCHRCSMKNRSWAYLEVKQFVEIGSKSGCKLLSDSYNGVLSVLRFKCFCGLEFEKPFHQFKDYGARNCGNHNISLGEKEIVDYCLRHKIPFKTQYTFEECKNKRLLPFDVAIFNSDGSVKMLIEYNGEQHYEPKGFGLKDESKIQAKFERQVENDLIKEKYCFNNKIKLHVIPYWQRENLREVLDEILMCEEYKEV